MMGSIQNLLFVSWLTDSIDFTRAKNDHYLIGDCTYSLCTYFLKIGNIIIQMM
jgi:hypothetical protein